MVREETEVCPNCDCENVLKWDVERNGYKVYCQHCGAEMMLCDACFHSDDNPEGKCDWSEEGGCWRMEENRIEQIMKENNGWIPVSTGVFPKEGEAVQITYLLSGKPYSDDFAFRKKEEWYWHTNKELAEVTITAWKPMCEPYVEPREEVTIAVKKETVYSDSFMVTKEELESIRKGTVPEYIWDKLEEGIKKEEPRDDWEAVDENGNVLVGFM